MKNIFISNFIAKIPLFLSSTGSRMKSFMLATNRHQHDVRRGWLRTASSNVDKVIDRLDEALLSYENVIASSAGEGIDMKTKDFEYRWTYVQSVFFTSTIITTVGKLAIKIKERFKIFGSKTDCLFYL